MAKFFRLDCMARFTLCCLALGAGSAVAGEGPREPLEAAPVEASAPVEAVPAAAPPVEAAPAAPIAAAAPKTPAKRARHIPAAPEAGAYRSLIAKHAGANGVPVALADAVVRIESRYNARVVHAGNFGLMQIRPQTARGVGFSGPPSALLDPDVNLRYGVKYLAVAYRQAGGDTCAALRYYQSGLGARGPSGANRVYCRKAKSIMASR